MDQESKEELDNIVTIHVSAPKAPKIVPCDIDISLIPELNLSGQLKANANQDNIEIKGEEKTTLETLENSPPTVFNAFKSFSLTAGQKQ